MANDQKRVSELPTTNSIALSDRLVVLKNPDSSPSVRTITVANLLTIKGPYSDDAAANAGGISVGEMYYHPEGWVKVRLS